jgi:hypothetical protein
MAQAIVICAFVLAFVVQGLFVLREGSDHED